MPSLYEEEEEEGSSSMETSDASVVAMQKVGTLRPEVGKIIN